MRPSAYTLRVLVARIFNYKLLENRTIYMFLRVEQKDLVLSEA